MCNNFKPYVNNIVYRLLLIGEFAFFVLKSSIKPPNDIFLSTFVGGGEGLKEKGVEKGGLFNLAKCISRSKVSPGRTCGYRALYCFFLMLWEAQINMYMGLWE